MSERPYALDLGTTKFCIATKNGSNALETVSVLARGMQKGMLSNLEEAKDALNQLIETAEHQLNEDINKVYVGISGSHLTNFTIEKTVSISTNTVTESAIKDLEKQIISEISSPSREIIHTIPVSYTVDGRSVKNPLGFSASELKAQYFVVEASRNYLKDVVRLCNSTGLEVSRFVAEPLASAHVSASEDLKNIGVVVCDIGGGTTDGVIFIQNQPVKIFTVNIGGEMMTNDLAIGLGLTLEEAEKLKILWGLKFHNEESVKIEVKNAVHQKIKVDSKDVFDILEPRIQELSQYISQYMQAPLGDQLRGGILLTGGGSEVLGLASYMNHFLHVHVHRQKPQLSFVSEDNEISTKFATVSGMLKFSLEDEVKSGRRKTTKRSSLMGWFRDFF